jgi:hypothetical protein
MFVFGNETGSVLLTVPSRLTVGVRAFVNAGNVETIHQWRVLGLGLFQELRAHQVGFQVRIVRWFQLLDQLQAVLPAPFLLLLLMAALVLQLHNLTLKFLVSPHNHFLLFLLLGNYLLLLST